ncbi:diguanylate cyclase [Amycolatopsis sp. NPDC051128]|uniref:GGDEF domain-containing response regulator n=1 Tax=Amycolatopsis sp. NPDC051128 TaxID=3155412 RepID=UPI003413916B
MLVADDSLVIRAVVRAALEEEGYRVTEACDGTAAVEQCQQNPPDVVLLDIEMGGLNGHEVLAVLKSDQRLKEIPVVFLTGRTSLADVVAGLRGGAHDYLKKPFETAELLARVASATHVKNLQDQLQKRNTELEQVSSTDTLTGLPNRRHLEEQLEKLRSAARRHKEPLTVILFDIDHFKRVNDTYGHVVGDLVLREFAHRLSAQVRREDTVCRWGGEEFLVILPGTDIDHARPVAERIRRAISAPPMIVAGHHLAITVSGGCALGPGDSMDELIRQADARLYEAKDMGRNRIVAPPPADATMP